MIETRESFFGETKTAMIEFTLNKLSEFNAYDRVTIQADVLPDGEISGNIAAVTKTRDAVIIEGIAAEDGEVFGWTVLSSEADCGDIEYSDTRDRMGLCDILKRD